MQLLDQQSDVYGRLRVCRRSHITQIRVGIERSFKFLSIDLSVFVQDVCINSRNHIDLGVTGVALSGLQVAVIQLELVGRAGMTQRVEDHVRESCRRFELLEIFLNHPLINRASVVLGDHQIEILVLIPQELDDFSLRLLPLPKNIGQRLGKPDLADTAFRLRTLQHNASSGVFHHRLKDVVDVLLANGVDCLLRGAGYFFVNVDPGVICGNVRIRDVNIVPGKAQNLAHTQRTGKGKVHRQIKPGVVAGVQRLTDGIRVPDVALLVARPGQHGILKRILGDQLPADCLLESAAQELDDLLHVGIRQELGCCPVSSGADGWRLTKCLNVLIDGAGGNVLHIQMANDGIDVVVDQSAAGRVHGHAPFLFAVQTDEIFKKFPNRLAGGSHEGSGGQTVFDIGFRLLRFLVSGTLFPFLFGLAQFILVPVYDAVASSSFYDRCHTYSSSCVVRLLDFPTTRQRTSARCGSPFRFARF